MDKIALITFGCAKNLVDSEVMLGYLSQAGFSFVSNPDEGDIIILNTCGFIQPARDEVLEAIQNVIRLKRKTRRKRIIVSGCYVEKEKNRLIEKFPEVDFWLGVADFDKIVQAVRGLPFEKSKDCFLYSHTSPRWVSTPPGWAYLKVSEGCSHQCSFCIIPLIKGSYRSRRIASILEEARNLAQKDVKELNLISQDTTYFGRDLGLSDGLTLLLQELVQIQGIEWIRILYGYPEEISDSLLEVMQEKKICSYLDLPFQHSDPQILGKMKRSMDGKRALALISKIRQKLPDVALRTSLIVGFPSEGRKEFGDLKRFVREAKFDHLGVFTYSLEKDTEAFSLGDDVRENEKRKRKEEIMEIQAEISYENNKKRLKQKVEVLIEGTLEENAQILIGRGRFQAPEVDGVLTLESSGEISHVVNTIQTVEIVGADVYDLQGKLIP
jgi:ribosomal protein S12 methylthiotransferase